MSVTFTPQFLADLRRQFAITRDYTYLNNGAVGPMPACALAAIEEYSRGVAERGDLDESRWHERREALRDKVARLIHADRANIGFVRNTSEAIAMVANGFPWQPGDNVITTTEEFPANAHAWVKLRARGVEVRLIPPRHGELPLDAIEPFVDGRTRVIALSFVAFSSGYRLDVAAVSEFCRARGILFALDAIQGLGPLRLDVGCWPVGAVECAAAKWLLAPPGIAFLYVSPEWIDRIAVTVPGWRGVIDEWDFLNYEQPFRRDAVKFEYSTLAYPSMYAFDASLALILELGPDAIEQRVLALTDRLADGLGRLGLEIYSSRAPGAKSGCLVFLPRDEDARALDQRLRADNIVVAARRGRVRVSPYFYNTEEEIDILLAALARAPGRHPCTT